MHPIAFNRLTERWQKANEQLDRRSAQICAVIANAMRCVKEGDEPFEASDFMPRYETEEEADEEDDGWGSICGQMKALAARWGSLKEA